MIYWNNSVSRHKFIGLGSIAMFHSAPAVVVFRPAWAYKSNVLL